MLENLLHTWYMKEVDRAIQQAEHSKITAERRKTVEDTEEAASAGMTCKTIDDKEKEPRIGLRREEIPCKFYLMIFIVTVLLNVCHLIPKQLIFIIMSRLSRDVHPA